MFGSDPFTPINLWKEANKSQVKRTKPTSRVCKPPGLAPHSIKVDGTYARDLAFDFSAISKQIILFNAVRDRLLFLRNSEIGHHPVYPHQTIDDSVTREVITPIPQNAIAQRQAKPDHAAPGEA